MAEVQVPVSKPTKEEVPPQTSSASTSTMASKCSPVNVALRVMLFSVSLVAVVVMATSKQTQMVPFPGTPGLVPREAKFDHSPAFIYLVAAMSVCGLYSILTTLASISVISKPIYSKNFTLQFAIWDTIMLGIVAAATGAAGGVGYIGLKGNDHTAWNEICDTFDKFCQHVGSSIVMALLASILLVLLVILSTFSLYKRIPE